jgi:hypothetical protein
MDVNFHGIYQLVHGDIQVPVCSFFRNIQQAGYFPVG